MCVWWRVQAAVIMRMCYVTTLLMALALRTVAEPAPRHFITEWRGSREMQVRSRPLHDIFEESAPTEMDRSYIPHQPVHKDRRRLRNNKRAPHLPTELASQMMLRASRSGRPYDVPQIGKYVLEYYRPSIYTKKSYINEYIFML
ncbi:unnamed protein product [Euphydryas editha]|uniref:Uncharacterized protein n=1 Tax=Euphydryas editha TaxID=104508 RepID=A0AAU9TCN8_EUPED|nr:unnamed protein product [Euphydryas editha]